MHLPNTAILKHISQNLQPVESKMQTLKKNQTPTPTANSGSTTNQDSTLKSEAPTRPQSKWNTKQQQPASSVTEKEGSVKSEIQATTATANNSNNSMAKKSDSPSDTKTKSHKNGERSTTRQNPNSNYYYDNGYTSNR
jgi:hypothetical protein